MTADVTATARDTVAAALHVLDGPVLVYFLAINTSYLLLVVLAALEFARHLGRAPFAGHAEAYANPLAPPVSLLVPAHDEELSIVEAVGAMLALRYPAFEVVVCDDGSRDATFERLRAAYDLVEVPPVVPGDVPLRGELLSVHVPADGRTPLVVARTTNGGRAAALNACLELAQHPLVCMVDADSLLDPDALLAVAKPFADDPLRVAATGGVIRPVNGCAVLAGRVVEVRMPPGCGGPHPGGGVPACLPPRPHGVVAAGRPAADQRGLRALPARPRGRGRGLRPGLSG